MSAHELQSPARSIFGWRQQGPSQEAIFFDRQPNFGLAGYRPCNTLRFLADTAQELGFRPWFYGVPGEAASVWLTVSWNTIGHDIRHVPFPRWLMAVPWCQTDNDYGDGAPAPGPRFAVTACASTYQPSLTGNLPERKTPSARRFVQSAHREQGGA